MFNSGTKNVMWNGYGDGAVTHDGSPQDRQRRAMDVVVKILEGFPPTSS